jgi:uncharacterized protein (DUF433 family)
MPKTQHLISAVSEARQNILRYSDELQRSRPLQEIMSYARGWYACRDKSGDWAIAPSKFAGYADNDAESYVRHHQQRDGRLTERLLSQWFVEVTPGTTIYADLTLELAKMFAHSGKTPNKRVHLHVLKSDLTVSEPAEGGQAQQAKLALLERVTYDADVLGGRPLIRGLRVSVGDVLDLLAAGASREEILADFPYLEDEDISAALEYAARAVDHRVVNAA